MKGIRLDGKVSSHLQFIDDTLLFGTHSVHEAQEMDSIIEYFMEASNTTINKDKYHLLFFNVPLRLQVKFKNCLDFKGVPSC